MSEKKYKYTRLGTVLKGEKNSYIALGNPKAKDAKYRLSVEITVKDAEGNIVAQQTNGFVNVFDPRLSKGKDGEAREVPENVLFELSLSEKL